MTERQMRAFEMTIDIDSPRDAVWDALTRAEELVRWFPLQAQVEPGAGGAVTWSWNGAWEWRSAIDRWEPGRMLRLVQPPQTFDVDGRPIEAEPGAGPIVMEFTIETRGGHTTLRLVHSGFGLDASWDDEFEGISAGWPFELRALKHYLEGFQGRDRASGLARTSTALDPEAVWSRLLSPEAFQIDDAPYTSGKPVVVRSATGERWSGRVFLHLPLKDLSIRLDDFAGGIFRIGTHRAGGRTGVTIWTAAYGDEAAVLAAFTGRADRLLDRVLHAVGSTAQA